MSKMLSALVGVSMLGLVGVANAAEPAPLSDAQLDSVTAGLLNANSISGSTVSGGTGNVVPVTIGIVSLL